MPTQALEIIAAPWCFETRGTLEWNRHQSNAFESFAYLRRRQGRFEEAAELYMIQLANVATPLAPSTRAR